MGRYSPNVRYAETGLDISGGAEGFLRAWDLKQRQRQDESEQQRRDTLTGLSLRQGGYTKVPEAQAREERRIGASLPGDLPGGYRKTSLSQDELRSIGDAAARAQQRSREEEARQRRLQALDAAMGGDMRMLWAEDRETAEALTRSQRPATPRNIDPLSAGGRDARLGYERELLRIRNAAKRQEGPSPDDRMAEAEGLAYLNERVPAAESRRRGQVFRDLRRSGVTLSPGRTALAVQRALGTGRTPAQGGPGPPAAATAERYSVTDPGHLDRIVASLKDRTPADQLRALSPYDPTTQAKLRQRLGMP